MMGMRGGMLKSPSSSPSLMKTQPSEEPRSPGNQIQRWGVMSRAPEMGMLPRPRRWHPTPHLHRAGSLAAKSSSVLWKTHASPLSAAVKIMTVPSTTDAW
jgi:hypothetical protein